MKNANATLKALLLAAMVIALAGTPGLSAEKKSWEDETVLVSKQGDQAVVRKMNDDKVLFKSKDGEAAMVWAMANGRTTVVLAGKYFLSKSVVPPRDGARVTWPRRPCQRGLPSRLTTKCPQTLTILSPDV